MLAGFKHFLEYMVVREATDCFLTFEILLLHDCVV